MLLKPLVVILFYTLGPLVGLMIFYWIVRLAVRHGIEDAWRRRDRPPPESGYWDPARIGAQLDGPAAE